MADTYEINTLSDIVKTYAVLPPDRGELFLKEIGDAVRMMSPLVGFADLGGPLRWIDDNKGTGTVNFQAASDRRDLGSLRVNLNERGAA